MDSPGSFLPTLIYINVMTKYILVLLSMGAYAYVSNQTFEDELRAKESVQVQQTENLSQ